MMYELSGKGWIGNNTLWYDGHPRDDDSYKSIYTHCRMTACFDLYTGSEDRRWKNAGTEFKRGKGKACQGERRKKGKTKKNKKKGGEIYFRFDINIRRTVLSRTTNGKQRNSEQQIADAGEITCESHYPPTPPLPFPSFLFHLPIACATFSVQRNVYLRLEIFPPLLFSSNGGEGRQENHTSVVVLAAKVLYISVQTVKSKCQCYIVLSGDHGRSDGYLVPESSASQRHEDHMPSCSPKLCVGPNSPNSQVEKQSSVCRRSKSRHDRVLVIGYTLNGKSTLMQSKSSMQCDKRHEEMKE